MPTFNLTPDQRRAVDAFRWLYSKENSYRRSGRTFAIALGTLQRILLNQSQWVDTEDHYIGNDSRRHNSYLLHQIHSLAADVGCLHGIEVHLNRLRIKPNFRVTTAMLDAVLQFGVLDSARRVIMGSDVTVKSLWEHLREDEVSDRQP